MNWEAAAVLREPETSQATSPSHGALTGDPAEVRRTARRHLGRWWAASAFRDIRLLARELRPGEQIIGMTLALVHGEGLIGMGRLVVATDQRLLIVEKGSVSGRERVIDIPWTWLRTFQVDGLKVRIATPEREIRLTLAGSREANGDLIEQLRACTQAGLDGAPHASELRDRLVACVGRLNAAGHDSELLTLVALLEPGENVLDFALGRHDDRQGLLVATTDRLVFMFHEGLVGTGTPVSYPYADHSGVESFEAELCLVRGYGHARFEELSPKGRAAALASTVRARLAGR
jgi:hypothetical protein